MRVKYVLALIAFVAIAAGLAPAVSQTPPLPGIDVSHWQESIDWGQVAANGKLFAIIKATEGTTFIDPRYQSNVTGASAAGLKATAYHFARPDTGSNDAVNEADHFVDVAQIGGGFLLPALDVEVNGGLSPSGLVAWIRAWLGRVAARTGVRPMIYTSPSFWQSSAGNSATPASAGYPLWIAHWTSASGPTVPASNWAGRGWTFWQWSSTQSVPGINGNVDADRYGAADFAPVTVRGLSVTTVGGGTVTGDRVDCGAVCTATFHPGAQVTLTATPGTGSSFVGWGGDCAGSLTTCTLTMEADRNVTAMFGAPSITVALTPATANLRDGQTQTLQATVRDSGGTPVPGAVVDFASTGANQNAGSGITDTNGVATFRYAGYHPGTDTVTAASGGARSTASVTWQGCPGFGSDARNQIVGTAGADSLTGTHEDAVVCGLGGNDTLRGREGNDLLLGGSGDDRLLAQTGDDVLYGEAGNDLLSASAGNDALVGGTGADRLYGAEGADRIYGGDGADYVSAWTGDDTVRGDAGNDSIAGGDGNDRIVGGSGADRMYGQDGNDRLWARDGVRDVVGGGAGSDVCSTDGVDARSSC
jgi:GH25 family lysozyme M1 (1,4-beta-N-acetylmuramidase)